MSLFLEGNRVRSVVPAGMTITATQAILESETFVNYTDRDGSQKAAVDCRRVHGNARPVAFGMAHIGTGVSKGEAHA
jgi:hypothetical protein